MSAATRVSDVLRIRRHSPTRLEGFVDASFAFAVTLALISIGHMPTSVPEMLQAMRGLPAFAFCFVAMIRIWRSHRDWSRHYDIEDATSLNLSLLLVFVVLIFVYPMRLLFSLFFAWISGGFLVDQPLVVRDAEDLRAAFEVYGLGFAALSVLFALLYRHALRQSAIIGLDARETIATRMNIAIWTVFAALACLSILSAMLLPFRNEPPWVYTIPGMIFALSGPLTGAIKRYYARRLAALASPA